MNSVPIIASPVSAPWIPWVLLVLLVLLGVDLLMDGSSILDVRRLFSMPERSYSENSNRLLTGIVSSLFRTGTFAMAVYVSCWKGQNMSVAVYLEIVAMIYVITVVRYLIIWLLYMIFRFAPKREVVGKRYVQFASITAILMYISLLVLTNWSSPTVPYVMITLVGLFYVCVFQMMLRAYTTKFMSLIYVCIGFISIEILPLALLVTGSVHLIIN